MNLFKSVKQAANRLGNKVATAVALGGAAMAGAFPAVATPGGGTTFDASTIVTAIGVMVAAGVLIYTAYVLGKWSLRVFALIGGK